MNYYDSGASTSSSSFHVVDSQERILKAGMMNVKLDDTDGFKGDDVEFIDKYMKLSIEELNMKVKIPSVLMKFYQAFLFECDWELLFQFLDNILTTGFCHATMMKLLIYLMCNVTKIVCVASEREGQNRNLDKLLKQGKYREVVAQLHQWAFIHKYSIYSLPQQDIQTNITAYDLKHFKDYARDTREIYYHKTKNQVNLEIKEMEFEYAGIHIKYIDYNADGCNKMIFDLLRITLTATNTKIDLSKMSWQQRLDKLKDIFDSLNIKENIAELRKTTIRAIQHDKLCPGSMYNYIRTCGLDGGTIFFTSTKKIRCTNMPKKRFRKLELSDLIEKQLKPKDLISHVNTQLIQADSMFLTNAKSQQQQLATQQLLSELISKLGTVHSILLPEQQQGLQHHLSTLQYNNQHQEQQQQQQPQQQSKKPDSPIPSPKHELTLEYLGNLILPEEECDNSLEGSLLQYETFNDDDDF